MDEVERDDALVSKENTQKVYQHLILKKILRKKMFLEYLTKLWNRNKLNGSNLNF